MSVTAEMVKRLREKTGLSMMDCKNALVAANGDEEGAVNWLKQQGKAKEMKMQDRVASEGRVAIFLDKATGRGAIVELRCETAPVANTDDFMHLVAHMAQAAAARDGVTPEQVRDLPHPARGGQKIGDEMDEVFNRLRENMQIARVTAMQGHLGHYLHHNAQVGVLMEFSEACPDALMTDMCMHAAWNKPPCVSRSEADPADVERKRAEFAAEAAGKPAAVAEKMVSGKLERWYSEFVLLEQPFVKEEKFSVQEVLRQTSASLTIKRFVRYEVGGVN